MSTLLMLIAVLCIFVATLLLFGIFAGAHALGWLALGLLFWAIAVLVGGAGPIIERIRA